MPTDVVVASAIRVGTQEFRRGFEEAPGAADLIAQQPGLYSYLEQAAIGALRQCLERRLPDVHVQLANIAKSQFSAVHLRRINAFYESSSGQALLHAVANAARPPADMVDAEGNVRQVTAEELRSVAEQTPITSLSRADQIAIGLFSQSAAGARLAAVSPQLAEVTTNGINGINAQSVPFLQQAVTDAFAQWAARDTEAGKPGAEPE